MSYQRVLTSQKENLPIFDGAGYILELLVEVTQESHSFLK